jgi:hypothetical protein
VSLKILQAMQNETRSYQDDLRIAAYIQRTEVEKLRQKREDYAEYNEEQKQKMVKFLTGIHTKPITTPFLNENKEKIVITPIKFSVFEGLTSTTIPTVAQIHSLKDDQQVIPNIFIASDNSPMIRSKL